MPIDVKIPHLGESVSEGVVAKWLKKSGDAVQVDEPILELETDKASVEIPAPTAGTLETLVSEGDTVSVGTVIARIAAGDAKSSKPKAKGAKGEADDEETASRASEESSAAEDEKSEKPSGRKREGQEAKRTPAKKAAPSGDAPTPGPAVRKLLEEHGLDPADIEATGKGGRLTKADVLDHLDRGDDEPKEAPVEENDGEEGEAAGKPAPKASASEIRSETVAQGPAPDSTADVERVPMTTLRRRIAERLVEAQRTAAILTTFNEIDLSAVLDLRKRYKDSFKERYGVSLGFMSLFGRASILALREIPGVNARIDGTDVVYNRRVHLGIAVSTERGLVVPVVRGADSMSLADLEKGIGEMAAKARDGKLRPDDLAGGTFTITNGGVFGSLLSTPILNPPQSGVLGMHKIEERPVVSGGEIVIRPMMYVALSYDHRLVDGREAVTFLVRVKERLEDPARMLLEV